MLTRSQEIADSRIVLLTLWVTRVPEIADLGVKILSGLRLRGIIDLIDALIISLKEIEGTVGLTGKLLLRKFLLQAQDRRHRWKGGGSGCVQRGHDHPSLPFPPHTCLPH